MQPWSGPAEQTYQRLRSHVRKALDGVIKALLGGEDPGVHPVGRHGRVRYDFEGTLMVMDLNPQTGELRVVGVDPAPDAIDPAPLFEVPPVPED